MKNKAPTPEEIRSLLHYDPESGDFRWRERPVDNYRIKTWNSRYAGTLAGALDTQGRLRIQLRGQLLLAHRVAWAYVRGSWPADQIDHVDGCPANNKFRNLRECSRNENMQNLRGASSNSSGLLGVSWYAPSKKWRAQIEHEGKKRHLGYFLLREHAYAAYLDAKEKLHAFQPTPR